MGRQKNAALVVKTEVNMEALDNATSQIVENGVAAQYFLDKCELMQQTGRIQALDFTQRVVDIAIAKTFDEIRISKKYKDLPYRDESGNLRNVVDLEEFCRAYLGKSYNRCLQLSQTLNLLGEELYEATQKIGFRARDYAALRALPPEAQDVIKQAITTESREALLGMIEDMALRHDAKERELTGQLNEVRETLAVTESISAKKSATIDKLQTKYQKILPQTPDEEGAQLRQETGDWAFHAEGIIRGQLRDGLEQLAQHAERNNTSHDEFCAGLLAQIERAVAELRSNLGIKSQPDGDPRPEWDR